MPNKGKRLYIGQIVTVKPITSNLLKKIQARNGPVYINDMLYYINQTCYVTGLDSFGDAILYPPLTSAGLLTFPKELIKVLGGFKFPYENNSEHFRRKGEL